MKKRLLGILISVTTVLCAGVAYLTVDDPNYLVHPSNILEPLSADQVSHWNHFVTATTQLVANVDSDEFDKYLTDYLSVAEHPELTQNTTIALDSIFPIREFKELSMVICARFSELTSEGSHEEATSLISRHIVILQRVKNGARAHLSQAPPAQSDAGRSYG